MKKVVVSVWVSVWLARPALLVAEQSHSLPSASEVLAGSGSCRQCHESFYQLWAISRHGLAMQPYSPEFARENLTPAQAPTKARATPKWTR